MNTHRAESTATVNGTERHSTVPVSSLRSKPERSARFVNLAVLLSVFLGMAGLLVPVTEALAAAGTMQLVVTPSTTTFQSIGQVITYNYTLFHTGDSTTNDIYGTFAVTDSKVPSITCPATPTRIRPQDTTEVPGITCTGTYTVTAADIAAGSISNGTLTATGHDASSAGATVTATLSPVGTTTITYSPLTITSLTAPNVIIDSNKPASQGPSAFTAGAKYCNAGTTTLTDVFAYIGDGNTPGTFPSSACPGTGGGIPQLNCASGGSAYSGTFKLAMVDTTVGSLDSSRYLNSLAPGQCKSVYWQVKYDRVDSSNRALFGATSKVADDLRWNFTVWALGKEAGVARNGSLKGYVIGRSEITANPNKIAPSGSSQSISPASVGPGQSISITYNNVDFSSLSQGFDVVENSGAGNGIYDTDFWFQPIGNASYWNPRLFRLAQVDVQVRGSGSSCGQNGVVLNATDQWYFSHMDTYGCSGWRGDYTYTFVALDDGSAYVTPYQEAASGANNEKYNGDYCGDNPARNPAICALTSSIANGNPTLTKTVDKATAVAGDTLTYTTTYANTTASPVGDPDSGLPVEVRDAIPANTTYVAGSASCPAGSPYVPGTSPCTIFYSANNTNWFTTEAGVPGGAAAVRYIRWDLNSVLAANSSGTVGLKVTVNTGFTSGLIINTAGVAIADGATMREAVAITSVGSNTASIGDLVWNDADGSGTVNGGETGIAGAKVYVDYSGNGEYDAGEPFATTNASGAYTITGLAAGTFNVRVTGLASNYVATYDLDGVVTAGVTGVTLAAGQARTDVDFGYKQAASIGDYVWLDLNGNGSQDAGEYGIGGVKVCIDANSNGACGNGETFTTTAVDGSYLLSGLAAGTYTITVDTGTLPTGSTWTQTYDLDGTGTANKTSVTVTTGQARADVDFGYKNGGSIGDYVWNDANGNGLLDGGESGIAGVTVWLDTNNDGLYDPATETVATTSGSGYYVFGGLAAGTYNVRVDSTTLPTGYIQTYDLNGIATANYAPVTITTGQNLVTADFGYRAPSTDVAIIKTDGVASVFAGGTTTYALTVTNYGPDAAPGTVIQDAAVAGLVKTGTPSCAAAGGAVCPSFTVAALEGAGVVINTLPSGGSLTITVTANVTATSGSVTNTATVTAPPGVADPTPGNNSASDTDTITPVADLSITKTDGVASVNAGGTTTYTLTVTNNGPSQVTAAPVADTAPTGLTFGNWTCAVTTAGSGGTVTTACGAGAGTGNLNTSVTMKSGAVITYTVNATVSGTASGNLVNTATVSAPTGTTDSTPGNNSAIDTDTVTYNVSGTVFNDVNGLTDNLINGTGTNAGSTSLTAYLVNGSGNVVASSVISPADGTYSVSNIANGTYTVVLSNTAGVAVGSPAPAASLPAGWINTGEGVPAAGDGTVNGIITSVTVNNANVTGANFGITTASSIGDYVWYDTDHDGIQEAEEKGIAGVTVNLYTANGSTLLGTTQTDGSGAYTFPGLINGSYQVEFVKPAGYTLTGMNQGSGALADSFDSDADIGTGRVGVVLAGNDVTIDAGLYIANADPARVADFVWYDTNNDGVQNPIEPGIAGATVRLRDGAGAAVLATTVTDGNGFYEFAGLPAGSYKVEFVAPAGYTRSAQDAGNDDASDSDANPATGLTAVITLSAGQNLDTVDAGMRIAGQNPAGIGDFVWYDANNNGIQDSELGIPGVLVNLYDAAGTTLIASTRTHANGWYRFGGLAAGSYTVEFVKPNGGYSFSPKSQGGDTNLDSDAGVAAGRASVTVGAGQNRTDIDAGLYVSGSGPLSIGDYVWKDLDANGLPGADEGLDGTQVVLYDSLGNELARVAVPATTTISENYTFSGVGPGSYRVEVDTTTLPANAVEIADPDTAFDSATDLVGLTASTVNADFGYSSNVDFGDLPDSYGTLFASNGARHIIAGVYLGSGTTDAEADGQPGVGANGDNLNGANDENGVVFGTLVQGQSVGVTVTASAVGMLNAWADWNNNGAFEAGEQIFANQALTAGANSLAVAVPANAAAGVTALRFRVTDATGQGGDSPTGLAVSGEVEDYRPPVYAASQLGTVHGHLFINTDGNGTQDPGEPDLANVDVLVADVDGTVHRVSTDAFGDWTATIPVGAATADVDETDPQYPTGYTPTVGSDPTGVTALAGQSVNAGDDGYTPQAGQLGTVSGHLYIDTNGNGSQDPGEPNLANVDVKITDHNGGFQIVTSGADGNYSATVVAGSLIKDVQESDADFPFGYVHAEGTDPLNVFNAPTGQNTALGNDGYAPPVGSLGTVTGHLYLDSNGNGHQDGGESNLSGIHIVVTDVNGGTRTVLTDGNGNWSAAVPAGNASAKVTVADLPANHTQTEGTDPTGVTVPAGQTVSAGNDGYRPPLVSLSGTVFHDLDHSQVQNGGEPGTNAGSLYVTAVNGSNQAVATVAVNASGTYSLTVPGNATYALVLSTSASGTVANLPSGWSTTGENTSGTVDGTPDGRLTGIVLTTANVTGLNFGIDGAPPAASNDSATTRQDVNVTLPILVNDSLGAGATHFDPASIDLDPSTPAVDGTRTVPGEGTYTVNPDGTVTFDPLPTFTGVSTITYGVRDNLGQPTNVANITITVTGPGNPAGDTTTGEPAANPDVGTTPLNTPITLDVKVNDIASAGETLNPVSVDLDTGTPGVQASQTTPEGTWIANGDGTVTFTPVVGFTGVASLPYAITDSAGKMAQSTITITVTGGSTPIAQNDSGSTLPVTPITLAILDNDAPSAGYRLMPNTVDLDTSTPNSVEATRTTPEGTWTANPDGTVTFTPTADYNGSGQSFTGTVSLPYAVTDSDGKTATATITIVVNPTAAPVAVDDSASTPFNTPVTLTPAGNDTASPGAVLDPATIDLDPNTPAVEQSKTISEGVWTVNPNGTVTFTPANNYTGITHPVPYLIRDSLGHSATANLTVTVAPPGGLTLTGTVFHDLDGNKLQNGSELGTHAGGLYVTAVNGSSVAVATAPVNADGTYTLPVAANTSYTLVLSTTSMGTAASLPAGWTHTGENASGTPDGAVDGRLSVSVGIASVTGQNFGIRGANPVANDDTATTPHDTNVTLPILGNDTQGVGGTGFDPATVDLDPAAPGVQTTRTVANEGTYTVNPDGTVIFDPLPSFSGVATPIQYVVNDNLGRSTNIATITVVVGPDAVNDNASTAYNAPLNGSVTGNDVYPANVTFVQSGPEAPGVTRQGGQVTLNPNGTYSYTPPAGFSGTDTFTYTVCLPAPNQTLCDTATVTITVAPPPNPPQLRIVKTASTDKPSVGIPFTYTLTVTNTGGPTATGAVQVIDAVPAGIKLTAVSASGWNCTPTVSALQPLQGSATLTCTYTGSMGTNASQTLVLTAVPTGVSGSYVNRATVTGDNDTPNTSNCDGSAAVNCSMVTVTPKNPRIELIKRVTLDKQNVQEDPNGDGLAQVGDKLTYTFTLTNRGDVALTAVSLVDLQLDGGTLNCAGATAQGTAFSLGGGLAPNDSVVCTGKHTTTSAEAIAGRIENTAMATGKSPDGAPWQSVSNGDWDNVPPKGQISLAKTAVHNDADGDNVFDQGETVTYRFIVRNVGTVTLNSIVVTDSDPLFPAITCPSSSLAVGAQFTCTTASDYVLTLADETAGKLRNTATVTGLTNPGGNPVASTDTKVLNSGQPAALALKKTAVLTTDADNDQTLSTGDTLTYTLVATNTGGIALTNVTVADNKLGTALQATGACLPQQGSTLNPGQQMVCTATYKLQSGEANPIDNLANATGKPADRLAPVDASANHVVPFTPPAGPVLPLYTVGNRVWMDTDDSGTVNATEVGIDGVAVRLQRSSDGGLSWTAASYTDGSTIPDQVTSGGGYYQFTNVPERSAVGQPAYLYRAQVLASNFRATITGTGALYGAVSSSKDAADFSVDSRDQGFGTMADATNGFLSRSFDLSTVGSTTFNPVDFGFIKKTVAAPPDLVIIQSANMTTVARSGALTYTLQASNAVGAGDLTTSPTVTETLPSGFTVAAGWPTTQPIRWSCSVGSTRQTVICRYQGTQTGALPLAGGADIGGPIGIPVVAGSTAGSFNATATITKLTSEPSYTNNTAVVTVNVQ